MKAPAALLLILTASSSSAAEGAEHVLAHTETLPYFLMLLASFFILQTIRIKKIKIREIPAVRAMEEAVGRSTEMGKPVLFITGLKPIPAVSAIAAVNILGEVASVCASYNTPIVSPHSNSFTMLAAQEEIREAFQKKNNFELINSSRIFFVTDSQFPFAASVNSITNELKPSAIFYMGTFYAESLILTEYGQSQGAVQIAGTDSVAQMPFFITSCDYLLLGEEFFTASAIIKNDEKELRTIAALDAAKIVTMVLLVYSFARSFL